MSPKNQPRQDPRVAPIEMIVTRRKSALQRRQLRDKDRSMRSVTQLLKSPNRSAQSKKTQKVSSKSKSPKKKPPPPPVVQETPKVVERRPRVHKDRVWLKPRPNFRMVAKTNKRKLCVPQKETYTVSPLVPHSITANDHNDTDSLNDEDLLEILTCPSPVWWEEPPDPSYSEDAICTRQPSPEKEMKCFEPPTEIFTNKSNKTQDPKIISKRKKLENVLGCIKSRKNIEIDDNDDRSDLDMDLVNDEMLKNLENIDIPIEPVNVDTNEVKIETKDNGVTNEVDNEIEDVENIVPKNLPPLQRNPMHSTAKNVIMPTNINMNCDIQDNYTDIERNEINAMDSSPLNKNEAKDLDTISDTNIKFIDKVEDKELDDTSQVILDKIKKFFQEKDKKNKKEYITVYKIVDNDERHEVKNDEKSKINYFYKKCKNVRKKSDTSGKFNKNSECKTLAVPNSELKYCFKCSSIFETKDCHYCAISETRECVCEHSQEKYPCDSCDLNSKVNCSK